ncbi:MAG: hypothetical protein NZ455_04330 [Bacteroidia bacterium]|nr:hypothetical protein [Bacteroidia bacterium]MDW8347495.1 hypothetical protein [Bacteroidia bacterium]
MGVSLWAYAQCNAHKGTPKKVKLFFRLNVISILFHLSFVERNKNIQKGTPP